MLWTLEGSMNSESFDNDIVFFAIYKSMLVPLSRFISRKGDGYASNPSTDVLEEFLSLSKGDSEDLEIHSNPLEMHRSSILASLDNEEYLSAATLISISLEADVNGFMRIGCASKGYSNKKITQFISDVSLKTKIDLVFPLLGVGFPERYRNAIFEYIPFRNSTVHEKSIPELLTNGGEKESSIDKNTKRAKEIISSYPYEKILVLSNDLSNRLYDIPELKRGAELLHERFGIEFQPL